MYKIIEVDDKIRVPPAKFGLELEQAVKNSLEEKWEGVVDKSLGVVLAIFSIENIGEGRLIPGDGALYYPATFKVIAYQPEIHEIVRGEVIDITEFGAFLRFGPVDGMIHVSQVMSDFVSYEPKTSLLMGRETKRKLKEGDVMVARIVSVSMDRDQFKIGLTARQPGLGSLEWIEYDKKKGKIVDPDKPAKAAPEKKEKEDKKGGKKPAGKKK